MSLTKFNLRKYWQGRIDSLLNCMGKLQRGLELANQCYPLEYRDEISRLQKFGRLLDRLMPELCKQTGPLLAQFLWRNSRNPSFKQTHLVGELARKMTATSAENECLNRSFYTSICVIFNTAKEQAKKSNDEYIGLSKTFGRQSLQFESPTFRECGKRKLKALFNPHREQQTLSDVQSVSFALQAIKTVIGTTNDPATEKFNSWLQCAGHSDTLFSDQLVKQAANVNDGLQNSRKGFKRKGGALEDGQLRKLAKTDRPVHTTNDLAEVDSATKQQTVFLGQRQPGKIAKAVHPVLTANDLSKVENATKQQSLFLNQSQTKIEDLVCTPEDLAKVDKSVVKTLISNISFCSQNEALETLEHQEKENNRPEVVDSNKQSDEVTTEKTLTILGGNISGL